MNTNEELAMSVLKGLVEKSNEKILKGLTNTSTHKQGPEDALGLTHSVLYELFPGFQGEIYGKNDPGYEIHCYQYALTSVGKDLMRPNYILYPENDQDVIIAIRYAVQYQVKIAVRTGGHQYSGASSTNGDNILLDMSKTYHEMQQVDEQANLWKIGVSYSLREFNQKLGEHNMFVPHGQCSHVYLGGHAQTGGYGQLARSFGLFSDHIKRIRIITSREDEPAIKEIDRDTKDQAERELFRGVLGGSPGNFGVLTHIWVQPHKDSDHEGSRGFKAIYPYSKETLKNFLDAMVDMAKNEELPRNYDYCVSMMSWSHIIQYFKGENLDEQMREKHPELYGEDKSPKWIPMVVVFAQWTAFGEPNQPFDQEWFEKIENIGQHIKLKLIALDWREIKPMSTLTQEWIFQNVREFPLPYEKRTHLTNWTNKLEEREWSKWVAERIHKIQGSLFNPLHLLDGCKLAAQFQHFGGKQSRFTTRANDETAFTWRDSTLGCTLDIFFTKKGKKTARAWQADNEKEKMQYFCDQDRRLLWGSYDKDLAPVRLLYFENQENWDRLVQAKEIWDPKAIFSPNKFCVRKVTPEDGPGDRSPLKLGAKDTDDEEDLSASPVNANAGSAINDDYEEKMSLLLVQRRENFLQKSKDSNNNTV